MIKIFITEKKEISYFELYNMNRYMVESDNDNINGREESFSIFYVDFFRDCLIAVFQWREEF
jgi:outer membrane receptor for Fe3+-dicitrate